MSKNPSFATLIELLGLNITLTYLTLRYYPEIKNACSMNNV